MRLSIAHRLAYTYGRPVFLDPHVVRLRPREEAVQRLLAWTLEVTPAPIGRSEGLDALGNPFTLLWFEGDHPRLALSMTAEVETRREHPFDYVLTEPGVAELPVAYGAVERAWLEPYLTRSAPSAEVDALADEVAAAAGPSLVPVIGALVGAVYGHVTTVVREDGAAWAPAETLARGEGACRDHALLFIDACRALGVASRFVSGYAFGGEGDIEHQLHAWAEVYLPGAGWRGYDPSQGLAVTDSHVALAAAPEPVGAMPTGGSFWGDTSVDFAYDVSVERR